MEPSDNALVFHRLRVGMYALIFLIVVISGALYFVYNYSKNNLIEEKKIELKLLADNLASDHEGAVYGIRQFLITSGYLAEQSKVDSQSCAKILQRMSVVYPYFLNIGIADKDGNVTCSGVDIGRVITMQNDEDFQELKQQQRFTVSGYRISSYTGRPSVRFLQPIIRNNQFDGAIFVSFATEWLNGFSPSFDLPSGTAVTKFDKDGIIFMRYPNPITWSGTDQSDSELFKAIQEKKIGYIETTGLEGTRRLYYFRPIYVEGKIHAYISIGTSEVSLN